MATFYDSLFDCYMQCISIIETIPNQIKIGVVYHCKTKFFDGEDLYTRVFLPTDNGEIEIGTLKLEHFTECITPDFHGTAIIWNTLEEAWKDAKERAEIFVQDEPYFVCEKVDDGYEIREIHSGSIVRCYKVFETQEIV